MEAVRLMKNDLSGNEKARHKAGLLRNWWVV
jgi:hypothetical protein